MTATLFFKQLGALSGVVALGICIVHYLFQFQLGVSLSWASFSFFILFSILVFLLSKRSTLSLNPQLFTQVFLGFTIIKLVLSLILVLIFKEESSAHTKLYVLPFMGIYFIYTTYEVYFLTKIAKA